MVNLKNPGWAFLVAIMLLVVIIAGFVPAMYDSSEGQSTVTRNMNVSETKVVDSPLYATLKNRTKEGTTERATVVIFDSETGDSDTATHINLTESKTVTISGDDVTITYVEDIGKSKALLNFEYGVLHNYTDTQRSYIRIIPVLILVILLYLAYMLIIAGGNQ